MTTIRSVLMVFVLLVTQTNAWLKLSNPIKSMKSLASDEKRSKSITLLDPVKPKKITLPESNIDYYWNLNKVAFSLLPLAPGPRRKTIIEEIVKDNIWTLDQIQGIVNVNVAVRSTVVKLSEGGLLVHNPVAPTRECIRYIQQLEEQYGKVKYIVLGSLGLEHKSLAASFSQYFPDSIVYLQPGQWSFPLNLPDSFLGFPLGERLKIIPLNKAEAPWISDIDYEILGPLKFKSVGGFGETAFYHKKTQTLLVTDVVVKITDKPSPIIQEDPRAILFHSRDTMTSEVVDTEESRIKGWRRMALFALVFFPGQIVVNGIIETFRKLSQVSPEAALLGRGALPISGALYPWSWKSSGQENFKAFQGGLLVAPILQKLILNREPEKVLAWADKVSKWNIKRIISCHFENNIQTNGKEFRRAFTFLEKKPTCPQPFEEDLLLLSTLSDIFTKLGVVDAPRAPI